MKSQNKLEKTGCVAIVTGASSGIGRAIAVELARSGYRVYALARSLPDYFENCHCEQLINSGSLRPIRIDVTNQSALEHVFHRILANEGRLDCLVQAAGFGLAGAIEDTSSEEARTQFETNFFGTIHPFPLVLQQMRQQKHGLIVQLCSVAGILPIPFQAYYSAAKAALTALTLALADEVRPFGIRCMIVQAGDTKTGFTNSRVMAAGSVESDYAERANRSISRMAKDETGGASPESIASLIVRKMNRRRPPLILTPGLLYKLAAFLIRILPTAVVRAVIRLMYAS